MIVLIHWPNGTRWRIARWRKGLLAFAPVTAVDLAAGAAKASTEEEDFHVEVAKGFCAMDEFVVIGFAENKFFEGL